MYFINDAFIVTKKSVFVEKMCHLLKNQEIEKKNVLSLLKWENYCGMFKDRKKPNKRLAEPSKKCISFFKHWQGISAP